MTDEEDDDRASVNSVDFFADVTVRTRSSRSQWNLNSCFILSDCRVPT